MTIIYKERKYQQLKKENLRMMKSQWNETEKINLIEEGKNELLIKLLNAMNLLITI